MIHLDSNANPNPNSTDRSQTCLHPNPTILLVEDDNSVANTLRMLLEDDYHILHATTAEDGFKQAQEFHPDLVITDHHTLSGITGLEMAKQLKIVLPDLPIIMLSASYIEEEAKAAGIKQFFMKPFDAESFQSAIRKYITKEKSTTPPISTPAQSDQAN